LKRELRRQIKQDEFRSGLEVAASWLIEHQKEAKILATVVAVVVVGSVLVSSWQSQRLGASERAFAEALSLFHAPIQGESAATGESPGAVVYATAEQKYTAAAAAFDGVERRHGSLPEARWARYYAALCRIELGQLDEAEKSLTELAAGPDPQSLEPSMARLALAEIDQRRGRVDEAVAAYERLVDDASDVPRDCALMRLSEVLEHANRTDEAVRSYRRLYEEFPTSVYAQGARQRVEYLTGAAI
jgi:tetratricopeptide (TPR) repeat protein